MRSSGSWNYVVRASLMFIVCAWVCPSLTSAATAMIVYERAGNAAPRYRIWNGSAWGAEAAANSIGSTPQWVVLRGSPLNDQFALATLDNDEDVEVQIWNGTAWGSVFQATNDTGSKTRRCFDIAYEQLSGHLLLVYRESSTNQVRYRTHNGTSWSAEFSYAMLSNDVRWLKLIPKRNSDEMMIIAIGEDDEVHKAAMWNGSSFTNQTNLVGVNEPDTKREHADGAFEGLSGQALVAYNQDSNSPAYRTLTGAAWSGSMSAPSVGGKPLWTRMAADPASDKIIMTSHDQENDINITVWSGSAWASPLQVENRTANYDRRAMDVAFEPGGSKAIVVYDDNSSTMRFRTWDGFGWSTEFAGPTGGTRPLWNPQAITGMTPGQIFVAYVTDNLEVRSAVWNGSSFSSSTNFGSTTADKKYESFMIAVAAGSIPVLTSWQEVQP